MHQSPYVHEVAVEGWAILVANINTYHRDAFWGVARCLGFASCQGPTGNPWYASIQFMIFSLVLDPSSGKPFVLNDAAGHVKNAEDTESNIRAVSSAL
jgi:hypothetical protein